MIYKTSLKKDLANAQTFTEWSSIKEEYDRNQNQLDWAQTKMASLANAYDQLRAKQISNEFVNFDATTKGNEISNLAAIGGFGRENTYRDRELFIKVSDIVELLKDGNNLTKQVRDKFERNSMFE